MRVAILQSDKKRKIKDLLDYDKISSYQTEDAFFRAADSKNVDVLIIDPEGFSAGIVELASRIYKNVILVVRKTNPINENSAICCLVAGYIDGNVIDTDIGDKTQKIIDEAMKGKI